MLSDPYKPPEPSPYAEYARHCEQFEPEQVWAQPGHLQGRPAGENQALASAPTSHDLLLGEIMVELLVDKGTPPPTRLPSLPAPIACTEPTETCSHTQHLASARRKRLRSVEDAAPPATLDLDAIVLKKTKLRQAEVDLDAILLKNAKFSRIGVDGHAASFDASTYIRDRNSAVRPELLADTPDVEAVKRDSEVRLTTPEFTTPNKPKPKPHWRLDPLLQNARWYTRVTSRPATNVAKPIRHILATIGLMQNVLLATALKRQEFNIIDEDQPTLTGCDVALSPSTGILFRPLANLDKTLQDLQADVIKAADHYDRVVVVFEVKSYGIKIVDGEVPSDDADPHPPAVYRALGEFADIVETMNQDQQPARGSVKLAYALNGPREAARVIRAMADHPEHAFAVDTSGSEWLEMDMVSDS
jgi:hypothetical protein